jgi:hypothetical protein
MAARGRRRLQHRTTVFGRYNVGNCERLSLKQFRDELLRKHQVTEYKFALGQLSHACAIFAEHTRFWPLDHAEIMWIGAFAPPS